ncbi:MAG: anthranilate phosphoribosyltransferase [Candidatus Omnitrophota bacterium]
MIRDAILKLSLRKDLSFKEAQAIFKEIFDNKATHSQIAAFLVALRMKGETEEEISAAADIIRNKALKLNIRESSLSKSNSDEVIFDTCGTGGSGVNKFNISTAVSFIVSASGIKVAKHGNRAMSSSCGSADVFEDLGIKIDASLEAMQETIKKTGIGFLYAPLYHPALKEVAAIRRELGIRTIFNILGPLCSPVYATHQLLGVFDKSLVEKMARVLRKLGTKKAFVVCGRDLKDEITLTGETEVCFLSNRKIRKFTLRPFDFGLKKIKLKDILVKNVKESTVIIKNILKGQKGPARDIVLANASSCFYILGKVKNFREGVSMGASLIDSKAAYKKYEYFKNTLDSKI